MALNVKSINKIKELIKNDKLVVSATKIIVPYSVLPYLDDDKENKLEKVSRARIKNNVDEYYWLCYLSDYIKIGGVDKWDYYSFELGELLIKYLIYYGYNKYNIEYFLSWLPFLKPFKDDLLDIFERDHTSGYCCGDCDGDKGEYIQHKIKHEIEMISIKMNKVIIDYDKIK